MTTNNAPERPVSIQQALNSIRVILNAVKYAPPHLETVLGYIEGLECQLNPAMQTQPIAYMRKWAFDGVDIMAVPRKERPKGWTLYAITTTQCFDDDVPLYALSKTGM